MAALVGALVGLVVATILDAILGVALGHYGFLAILFGGLAAGLLMRQLAGGSGSPYLKGGLAALITGVAAVGGPIVAAQWFQAQNNAIKSRPTASASAPVADAAGDPDAADVEGEAVPEEVDAIVPSDFSIGANPSAYSVPSGGASFDGPEIVCMVVGCLLAYELGKGPGTKRSSEDEAAEGDGEADAEGSADAAGEDENAPVA